MTQETCGPPAHPLAPRAGTALSSAPPGARIQRSPVCQPPGNWGRDRASGGPRGGPHGEAQGVEVSLECCAHCDSKSAWHTSRPCLDRRGRLRRWSALDPSEPASHGEVRLARGGQQARMLREVAMRRSKAKRSDAMKLREKIAGPPIARGRAIRKRRARQEGIEPPTCGLEERGSRPLIRENVGSMRVLFVTEYPDLSPVSIPNSPKTAPTGSTLSRDLALLRNEAYFSCSRRLRRIAENATGRRQWATPPRSPTASSVGTH
jgi:hypothetical protein